MQSIDDLLAEFGVEPYTREQYDEDRARVLARLCEKHGVSTQSEVDEIIREHRYEHSGEDPEEEYISLTTIARHAGWA